jgi:hypothetical protein
MLTPAPPYKVTGLEVSAVGVNSDCLLVPLAARSAGGNGQGTCRGTPSCTVGSAAGFAGRAGFTGLLKSTLLLNMLLVAAEKPPVRQVLCVNTEAMFAISCSSRGSTRQNAMQGEASGFATQQEMLECDMGSSQAHCLPCKATKRCTCSLMNQPMVLSTAILT